MTCPIDVRRYESYSEDLVRDAKGGSFLTSDRVERRLMAIVAADMVGYSRLMEADEEGTLARQKLHRKELVDPRISDHDGRIVKTTGDGFLIEFGSVVDAVRCAVDVQKAVTKREANVDDDKRIRYRVGINLGDVIIDDDDVMGDGVNIAARLESMAAPGEVLISGTTFDHVKNKLDYEFRFLGERQLKNIADPVRTYLVLPDGHAKREWGKQLSPRNWRQFAGPAALLLIMAGIGWWQPWTAHVDPARPAKMAYPLPEKPSIAVLPFDNIGGDIQQDYLADGLTENITSTLSKIPGMFVIARNSTFTYKGKAVRVKQVAEDLGVRYVLEGSVQHSGDRIRVTAQLIDALEDYHVWSEQYDRKLTDLFSVQDEITLRIATELQVRFAEGSQGRLPVGHGTRNIKAWANAVQGFALFRKLTREENARAQQLLQEATSLDPSYAWAWTVLAWTHWNDARNGWGSSQENSFQMAFELATKSKEIDYSVPFTYSLLGALNLLKGEYEKAVALNEQAVALDPNGADRKALLGMVLTYAGQPEQAVTLLEQAMRLNPRYPGWYLVTLGRAYRLSGRPDDAIEALQRAKERIPRNDHARVVLTAAYLENGRQEEARSEAADILNLNPKFSIRKFAKVIPYKDPEQAKRILNALRQVGLPE